ncbi:MAG: FkbM family methyltransferase [Dysgonamonadaceae bacterium]|jgi:hypothetical protein|nr:FkbM family methyltransferase [Dysgonamonadaceae bacterium]
MNKTKKIKRIIKKFTPDFIMSIWRKYQEIKEKKEWKKWAIPLENQVKNYLENIPKESMTDEIQEILDYLRKPHSYTHIPYSYKENYNPDNVKVYKDNERGMLYVIYDEKRLYFKKDWHEKWIRKYYNYLMIEQDEKSPHRYETSDFCVNQGDIVVDAGAAEGNFALSVIEKVKKIYLFEVEEEWIDVLRVTFEPWKDKVVIIKKYISDNNENNCVTLDSIFENEEINFIKADIEGAEIQLLNGAKSIMAREMPPKIILCTYHNQNDAEIIDNMLTKQGFNTEFSKGFMIYLYETLNPPYLRRGLIRAWKNKKR